MCQLWDHLFLLNSYLKLSYIYKLLFSTLSRHGPGLWCGCEGRCYFWIFVEMVLCCLDETV